MTLHPNRRMGLEMATVYRFLVLSLIFLATSPESALGRRNRSSKTFVPVTVPPKAVDLSGIEYCEKDRYENPLKTACPAGYTFEKKQPECVCIKGIYRIYLDNCEIADGFIEGRSCTLPMDTHSGARMYSMQLIAEPNWERTHVVYEKPSVPGRPVNDWDIATYSYKLKRKVKVYTDADTFYTINGRAKIITEKEKQRICVETYYHKLGESNVCHYFKSDNLNIWTGNSGNATIANNTIEITVQPDSCGNVTNTTELSIQLMEQQECFSPLTEKNAECFLACDKQDEEANVDLLEDRSKASGVNCTDEEDFITHDNDFLDRKMSQYALMSNIKNIPPLRPLQPNKTFDLIDLMIQVSNRFCPDHYVPNVWVNHVMELFYILHKGREFKYEEILSDKEHKWIKGILTECLKAGYEIDLITDPMEPEPQKDEFGDLQCEGDAEKAWGYCNSTMDESDNCTDKVHIEPRQESTGANLKDKHYVPELAWNILDLTQAVCFREFNDSYRMFHVLEQAVEKLFTVQIKNLWYYPGYHGGSPDNHRKNKLLGLGADEIMFNMDICVSSAYKKMTQDQIPRLLRLPKYPVNRMRKKRAVGSGVTRPKPYKNPVCLKGKNTFTIPPACLPGSATNFSLTPFIPSGPVTPSTPKVPILPSNPGIPQPPFKPIGNQQNSFQLPSSSDDYPGNNDPAANDPAVAARLQKTMQDHQNHKQAGNGRPSPNDFGAGAQKGPNDYSDYAGNAEVPETRRRPMTMTRSRHGNGK